MTEHPPPPSSREAALIAECDAWKECAEAWERRYYEEVETPLLPIIRGTPYEI